MALVCEHLARLMNTSLQSAAQGHNITAAVLEARVVRVLLSSCSANRRLRSGWYLPSLACPRPRYRCTRLLLQPHHAGTDSHSTLAAAVEVLCHLAELMGSLARKTLEPGQGREPLSCLGLAGPAPELGTCQSWWAFWSRTRRQA